MALLMLYAICERTDLTEQGSPSITEFISSTIPAVSEEQTSCLISQLKSTEFPLKLKFTHDFMCT